MRNLKKALVLVLTLAMVLGIMVVGAGAAFTDQSKIDEKHQDAVDACVSLDIINGMADGSFDPQGLVTREQMAKMICILDNGGKEPQLAPGNSFTDVAPDRWSNKYIESCYARGVVAGVGDNKFNPAGNVTATQAAKMLLVELGYDQDLAKYVGSNWATNVNIDATKKGYYDELEDIDVSAPLSREHAAQMVWNALQAKEVEYGNVLTTDPVTGQLTSKVTVQDKADTLLKDKYDSDVFEGILSGSGKYGTIFAAPGTDKFDIQGKKLNSHDLPYGGYVLNQDITWKYEKVDLTGLAGEYVKVLIGKNDKVLGVYQLDDKNTVINTTTDKTKDYKAGDSIKIDDVKYDLDSAFTIYGGAINNARADKVKFVDNDKDGSFDLALVVPVGVGKVTFVGGSDITVDKKMGTANLVSATQKLSDVFVYDGIAKDDYVIFQKDLYKNKDSFTKADVMTGTVTGVRVGEWQVNGAWYKMFDDTASYDPTGANYTPAANDGVTAVALGSKFYFIEKNSGANSAQDVLIAVNTGNTTFGEPQAIMLLSDGTKVTAKVADTGVTPAVAGTLYTYTVKNSGDYELTAAANMTDYTWHAAGAINTNADTVGTFSIADDAVVFLVNNNAPGAANEGKIITGKQLQSMTTGAGAGQINAASLGFWSSKENGIEKATIIGVKTAIVEPVDNVTGSSSDNYAYIVADPFISKADGKTYVNVTVWDGKNTVDYKFEKNAIPAGVAKFAVIGFDISGDGMISDVNPLIPGATQATLRTDAIKGGGGSNELQFVKGGNQIYKIKSDTTVFYVNSGADNAADIGVAGGTTSNANQFVSGQYVQNVKWMAKSTTNNDLEVLVVDVNNKMEDRDTALMTWGVIAAGVNVYVNDTQVTANTQVAAGDLVKIENKSAAAITVNDGGTGNLNIGTANIIAAGASYTYTVHGPVGAFTLGAA